MTVKPEIVLPFPNLTTDLIVGPARLPGSGERIVVLDPSTEQALATVADASVEEALAAVEAAKAAAADWRARSPRDRAEILRRCWELMTERAEDIALLISLENGKSLDDARGEVAYAAEFFRWYSEEAVRVIGEISRSPAGNNRIVVQHEPIGVSVLITPWNFPAAMATRKIAPALAAGCTVVLKPATLTPLTAYAVADILRAAGVPDGVVNVVTTRSTGPVVSAMLHHPAVRAMSFTGSTEVGRTLLRESADQVLKCSMELGGNAPFIVLEDAEIESTVDALMIAKMRNGGQACTAANRILVHRNLMQPLADALGARMSALRVGPACREDIELGPLISPQAVAKVTELVDDAVHQGAKASTVGDRPAGPGYYYPPTVLVDVPLDAAIVAEEIFGPVASLIPFDNDAEAIELANDTQYGLAAYVYGGDLRRAMQVAERIEAGMVGVNRGLVSDPAAPFGGVKQSGLGREGSREGLLEFSETKYIAVQW
ncbi:NAD-dependent succinate-semialdehyde dehydrogenase [Streptomyces yatensis]|uniref:NAD-dependent succinate-semialdehyde dehydrogenase n=1 Tax=Streptomyces yatensis TaxID=155177 RepID=A0ABN2I3L2_9ACTN|nr:NAD-dependent succinate-semialdehyde dehydrogenase [Streptomyces yatensis]